jgi:glycine betaine catabolism B
MITLSICNLLSIDIPQKFYLQPDLMPNQECSIGRSSKSGLVLDRPEISRIHAKLSCQHSNYYFTDLASSAGSRIHNELVQPYQAYLLCVGDIIQIGNYQLTVMNLTTPEECTKVWDEISLTPEQYMPIATIPAERIDRWQKGDLTVRCMEIIDETADAKTFRFVAEPPVLFTYKPGQFVTLDVGIDGEQVLRSYSISSTPSRPHSLEITVKRVPSAADGLPPGLVSNWLHDSVRVGSLINLSGPFGKFTCFNHPDRKLLFISAGSGVTPMMSMSRWIGDTMANCDIVFLHSARHPDDIIYRQELELMSARHPNFRPLITLTRTQSGKGWLGLTGRIDANLIRSNIPDFADRTVFVCGPNAFMEATKQVLIALDYPMDKYHEESFGAPKRKTKTESKSAPSSESNITPTATLIPRGLKKILLQGFTAKQESAKRVAVADSDLQNVPRSKQVEKSAPVSPMATMATSNQQQMLVRFQKSNLDVACDGEESILDIAEQAGVKIRSSCRSGVCGSCKQQKLDGEVKMDDFDSDALEPSEQAAGYVLTCVAFPQGRVVMNV